MQAVGISVAHWAGGGGTVVLHCHRAALALSTAVAPLGKEGESFPALTQNIIFGSHSASNYERALVTLPCPVLRLRTSKIYFTCKGTAVCPMHKFGSFKGSVGTRQGSRSFMQTSADGFSARLVIEQVIVLIRAFCSHSDALFLSTLQ